MTTESDAEAVISASSTGAEPSGSGSGDVTAEFKAEMRKMVVGLMKDYIPKAVRQVVSEAMPAVIAQAMESKKTPETKSESQEQQEERLSLKALQSALEGERRARQEFEKRLHESEDQKRALSMRGEVRNRLAARFGADNKLVDILSDSLIDAKKRIVESDGRLSVRFQDEFGNEEFKPLDEGLNSLFENEYKELAQSPSKASHLPPAGPGRGVPMPQNGHKANPFYQTFAEHFAMHGDHQTAAALMKK